MHNQKIVGLIPFIFLATTTFGQLLDDFSDGDFTSNPTWSGDNSKFILTAGKLKLQAATVAETAFLSTPSLAIHNASWEFYLQMDFTPSSSNFTKIYLASDQSTLNNPLNGYFVKAGSTSRDVCLYRQNGMTETKIIDGTDDRLNVALVKMKIKVTRSTSGVWQLFSDVGPSGTYNLEGIVTDNSILSSSYFGIQCTYTSTRSDKFWFDDFIIKGIAVPDTTPPGIQFCAAQDSRLISILFSEPLDQLSAQETSNYFIQNFGNPQTASLQADQRTVLLDLDKNLTNGVAYNLLVSGVKDVPGNMADKITQLILYFKSGLIKNKGVIFTEIFPDPTPQIGLPAAEFVEIYNRSQDPFNLEGWELSDGSSVAVMPPNIILPGDYRILAATSSAILFSRYNNFIGLNNFPTLNNDGDVLTLKYNHSTIDSINYATGWYNDVDKMEGGWTIELIDINNPCGEQDNWTASENQSGGTPGQQNSVFANKPDLTPPVLLTISPDGSSSITLTFDEKLASESLTSEKFFLQPFQKILKSSFTDRSLKSIRLELDGKLQPRQLYALQFSQIEDCSKNIIENGSVDFGLPESADSMDVVINEVLFNPKPGGVDFIEVYNFSEKFLDLYNWKLGNYDNQSVSKAVTLFTTHALLAPHDFAVFTINPELIKMQYPQSKEKKIFKTQLPSLPDDVGSIVLVNNTGKQLDELSYDKAWHSEFVKNDEGISLERISYESPTNEKGNWISSSSLSGFATPGFSNSQWRMRNLTAAGVEIVPEVFAPGLGQENFVQIQYRFQETGWMANVKIYDQQGHLLKNIVSNESLDLTGFLRWDGDRTDGSQARAGYYFVWFEMYHTSGAIRTYKKRVIISSR